MNEQQIKTKKIYTENEVCYSYIAGFFDGEGSPCLTHRVNPEKNYSRKISVRLSIPNTDKATLLWMREKMGNVGQLSPRPKGKSYWTQCWDWHIGSYKEILDFSLKIRPFIQNKKKQAKFDIIINYCQLRMRKLSVHNSPHPATRFSDEEYRLVKQFFEVGC